MFRDHKSQIISPMFIGKVILLDCTANDAQGLHQVKEFVRFFLVHYL